MSTPDYFGEPTQIKGSLKNTITIRDSRRVQVEVIEEAIGCLRLRIRTDNVTTDLVMAEGSVRSLAARLADSVARMDAHVAPWDNPAGAVA